VFEITLPIRPLTQSPSIDYKVTLIPYMMVSTAPQNSAPVDPSQAYGGLRAYPTSPESSLTPGQRATSQTSPNPSSTPNSKATHVCDQCSRAFSRAEHLERHQTTHLPSTATKSFVCSSCGKGFTRKDVLTRHIRAVHETKKSDVRKSRRKSCRRCAAFKIKCTGGGRGKTSGERAEEPCEACRKRDVECIFDFGVTSLEKPDDAGEEVYNFASDGAQSDDTESSEYSVKRRKTVHPAPGVYPTTAAVSPHLLSAARLASQTTQAEEDQVPLPMNDQLVENQPMGPYYSGMQNMEQMPPRTIGSSQGEYNNLYFPSLRDNRLQPNMAKEDLNATNTLQGINPILLAAWKSNVDDVPAGGYNYSEFPRVPLSYNVALPQRDGQNGLLDTSGLDPGLELTDEDNFFFDFGIFDNSTDWLRDWGPNESISPESITGMEAFEGFPGEATALGLATPTPQYNTLAEVPVPEYRTPIPVAEREPSPNLEPSEPLPAPTPKPPSPPPLKDKQTLPTVSSPTPREHVETAAFLPWGWHRSLWESEEPKPSRKITLPPLRQVLTNDHRFYGVGVKPMPNGSVFDEVGPVTDRMRKEMIEVLTLPSVRPPYPTCEPSEMEKAFPSKEVIAGFVKLYFDQFHPILPVIHRPSFSIDRCPSILLIAMVSIGASYSNLKNAKSFADGLSELCKRCLGWMSENNPAYLRSAFYLTSLCLQNLYAMGSGSNTLYDAADVSRSVIIGNARRIGLFSGVLPGASSSPPSAPNSPLLNPNTPPDETPEQLNGRWREWREKEGLKRLAWGIFEYDSSFSTLSNRRGTINLNDIAIRIPCSEQLWEASTAAAWKSLLSCEPEVCSLPFYRTMQGIISGRIDANTLSSWGKRICAQAVGRVMWDFKGLEESVAVVGTNSFKPQKEMLLRSLTRVCESATPRAGDAEGDRYHWIIARLIAHYAHLHAAFPTISLMLNLARKPPPQPHPPLPQQQSPDTTVDPRVKRVKNIFCSDPAGARTLAWHAAQIIALSRWKPVFSPVEGMRLFLAGIVLWGFGNYYRSSTIDEHLVRLDALPWTTPGYEGRGLLTPDEWIRFGRGKPTIMMDEKTVDVCGDDGGAKEVLRVVVGILGSLRVWGLGGEFKQVLEELMAKK
jgi:hypothetical protein